MNKGDLSFFAQQKLFIVLVNKVVSGSGVGEFFFFSLKCWSVENLVIMSSKVSGMNMLFFVSVWINNFEFGF